MGLPVHDRLRDELCIANLSSCDVVGESLALHGTPKSLEKGTASPKSPQRKRTAKMGRVDYATMEALADLNYAMNRGQHAAVLPD